MISKFISNDLLHEMRASTRSFKDNFTDFLELLLRHRRIKKKDENDDCYLVEVRIGVSDDEDLQYDAFITIGIHNIDDSCKNDVIDAIKSYYSYSGKTLFINIESWVSCE